MPQTALKPQAFADWRDSAACLGAATDVFFPVGSSPEALDQVEEAKRDCQRCPVRSQCLAWALEAKQDFGVWGGLDEEERREIHGRRAPRSRPVNGKTVAQNLFDARRQEFLELLRQEKTPTDIARVLETNVQTVNNMLKLHDKMTVGAA